MVRWSRASWPEPFRAAWVTPLARWQLSAGRGPGGRTSNCRPPIADRRGRCCRPRRLPDGLPGGEMAPHDPACTVCCWTSGAAGLTLKGVLLEWHQTNAFQTASCPSRDPHPGVPLKSLAVVISPLSFPPDRRRSASVAAHGRTTHPSRFSFSVLPAGAACVRTAGLG